MPSAQQLDAWLTAVAAGDRRAFARLYAATSARLYAVLLRTLRQPALAEDALQDSYLRIWLKAGSYDPERSSALTWMAAVARHRALDLLRRQPDELPLPGPDDDPDGGRPPLPQALLIDERADPGERADEDQALERLQLSMRRLDPVQRRAIELAYVDGYTHEELAEILGLPLGTVKVRIRRGLARLRGIIGLR